MCSAIAGTPRITEKSGLTPTEQIMSPIRKRDNVSTGHGTSIGYRVETRIDHGQPFYNGELILTRDWARLSFATTTDPELGIPNNIWSAQAEELGLLDYEAAITLAMTFLSKQGWKRDRVEVRLVKMQVNFNYTNEEVGVGDPISFRSLQKDSTYHARELAGGTV